MSLQWSASRRAGAAALVSLTIATCRSAATASNVSATRLAFAVQPTSATAGTTLPTIRVEARDDAGNLDDGFTGDITLDFATNPSGGTLAGATTLTASGGAAEFTTLSILRSGIGYTLRATAGALTGSSAAFTVIAGPGSQLVFTAQPGNTVAGAPIAVTVTAQDSVGNTATDFSGGANSVAVAIGTNGGNPTPGTLSGPTVQTAASGVATFTSLTIDKMGSNYTLTATAPSLGAATSVAFALTPGQATWLAFLVQPSSATAAATIPTVVVTALDDHGNTDTAFASTIAMAIDPNPNGGSLGGTLTSTAAKGLATFTDLAIDRSGADYTLQATAGSLSPATSAPFAVSAGAAVKLVFTQQPGNSVEHLPITPCVQVTAQDAAGNGASDVGLAITITLTPGSGAPGATLSGSTGPVAVASGVGLASFCDLSIDKEGTGYTLSASAPDLPSAMSASFDVLEPAPVRPSTSP